MPGEKIILSNEVGGYLDERFFFYYRFYINYKHSGNPFNSGWTEWPAWASQLIMYFDNTVEEVRRYNETRALNEWRAMKG